MPSGAAFRTSVAVFVSLRAAFKHSRAAFAAQSRRSSGNGFQSTASFLKTCTVQSSLTWRHHNCTLGSQTEIYT